MRISKFRLKDGLNGLVPFYMQGLGDVVILAGCNGSGKSRLLKLLANAIEWKQGNITGSESIGETKPDFQKTVELTFQDNDGNVVDDAVKGITLINYSHYDAPLQSPLNFPPYAISVAKHNLEKCDFEETARDVLLYIQFIAKYCSSEEGQLDEFHLFGSFIKELAGIQLDRDSAQNPLLFGRKLHEAKLSPGQEYLLRMCAALYCNKIKDDNFILFLDEPETHLHPEAIWKLMEQITKRFGKGQIWIATHSVALLSMFEPSSIWHMEPDEIVKRVGSKSASLIRGLLGDEVRRFQLQQFVASPDWFACNMFAIECLTYPEAKPVAAGDLQVQMVKEIVVEHHLIPERDGNVKIVVVDYGAGKGRLIEGIGIDYPELLHRIDYYAYNKYDEDAERCKVCMREYGIQPDKYYFEDAEVLMEKVGNKVDKVLLVNVLHEIHPKEWPGIFSGIKGLLKEGGELVIVELEEFTYGEKPYDSGFLVIQEEPIALLNREKEVNCDRHRERKHIMRYRIPRDLLGNMDKDTMIEIVRKTGVLALNKVREIRTAQTGIAGNYQYLSQEGIRLAFWTQQFTDAHLILEDCRD